MTPSEQVKAIRARTGLSQAAFAARYDIPKRTIENWESGLRTPPPYVLRLLSEAVPEKKSLARAPMPPKL